MAKEMVDNSSGVAGVVLGILGIIWGGIMGWLGIVIGIIGLCFALNQKKHGKNKWSKYGYWLNIIAIALGIAAVIFGILYLSKHPELLPGTGAA